MAVRGVVFDADETLWDFDAARRRGLDRAAATLAEAARTVVRDDPSARRTAAEDAEALQARWVRLGDVAASGPGAVTMAMLRERSFVEAAAAAGVADPMTVGREMATRYRAERHGTIEPFADAAGALEVARRWGPVGLVTNGNTTLGPLADAFDYVLRAEGIGIRKPDRRIFAMAAAAVPCHPNEIVSVGDDPHKDVAAAQAVGARGVWLNRRGAPGVAGVTPDAEIRTLDDLAEVLARFAEDDAAAEGAHGVGPHPAPHPVDAHLDPSLLRDGDRRNVVDRYRYWREEAIVEDLRQRAHPFHVAVENWRHDRNIGTVVRNANAFGAAGVHIVGRRRWNRRGAMATDRYLPVEHHATVDEFLDWATAAGVAIVAIDNVAGSVPLEDHRLPERCVLVFGQEGPGLSAEVLARAEAILAITQFGSTRSLNAGVASGIAMHRWITDHGSR